MSNYKPCPICQSENVAQMGFTWWGGIIGPKILSHVKCGDCGKEFNGKSGKDNTTGIIIYSIAALLIVGALFVIVIAAIIFAAAMS